MSDAMRGQPTPRFPKEPSRSTSHTTKKSSSTRTRKKPEIRYMYRGLVERAGPQYKPTQSALADGK